MVLKQLLCFQQEMVTWMSENNEYLQERVMMVITKVLIFASKRVKKYVSH